MVATVYRGRPLRQAHGGREMAHEGPRGRQRRAIGGAWRGSPGHRFSAFSRGICVPRHMNAGDTNAPYMPEPKVDLGPAPPVDVLFAGEPARAQPTHAVRRIAAWHLAHCQPIIITRACFLVLPGPSRGPPGAFLGPSRGPPGSNTPMSLPSHPC